MHLTCKMDRVIEKMCKDPEEVLLHVMGDSILMTFINRYSSSRVHAGIKMQITPSSSGWYLNSPN